jgi:glycosyltransferase involved in cell wall biosynthesis
MLTIGVIIPNFNHGDSITETIESILHQTVLPDEIIVIDDASTDNSVKIISSLSEEISCLRLIRNQKNRGVNYCMNLGTREAKCDLIIYRAADDVFMQDAILNAQKAFQTYPQASIACGETIFFQDNLAEGTRETLALATQTTFFCPDKLLDCWQSDFNIPTSACITKKNAVLSVGGFKEQARWHADWLCLTTIAMRDGLLFIPHPLTGFRLSSSSYGNSNLLNRKKQRAVLKYMVEEVMNYEKPLQDRFRESGAFGIFGEPLKSLLEEESDSLPKKSSVLIDRQNDNIAPEQKNVDYGILGVVIRRLKELNDQLAFLNNLPKPKIVVYGAGTQTLKLLEIWNRLELPTINGIAVSQTDGKTQFQNLQITQIDCLENSHIDLFILSSKSFEQEMAAKLDEMQPSANRISFWARELTRLPKRYKGSDGRSKT